MVDINQIYKWLGGDSSTGRGFSYGLTSGNSIHGHLNTPNLWGHDPSITDYVPAGTRLTKGIEDLIAQTNHSVDISTLYHFADGHFLTALQNGIKRATADGKKIIIRMIAGLHYPYHTPIDINAELEKVARSLEAPANVPVYVAGMQTAILSMNHAKLVIVDGQSAICGGHNMWSVDYNDFAPAHDLSTHISGPGVAIAQNFLNTMWTNLMNPSHAQRQARLMSEGLFVSKKLLNGEITDDGLAHIDFVPSQPTGTIKTLAVARMGKNLMPDVAPGYDASHTAKLYAMQLCKEHIRFATPWLGGSVGGIFDERLLHTMCVQILNGVQVSIIMSEHGGTTSNGNIYYGESIEKSAKKFTDYLHALDTSLTKDQLIAICKARLHIAPIRIYPKQPNDPEAESWKWRDSDRAIEPANHAKIYIFDDDVFYFGSDNAYAIPGYPLGLQEFGYMVGDANETRKFADEYWHKGWQYSEQFKFSDWAKIIHF